MSDSLKLKIKPNLQEMKDWKQHFTNGTKGMVKTEPGILNYVESFLKKLYDGNEEKVNNNPIAPWLVKTINEIGPANINTEKINRLKAVVEYVKKTGNVANIPKMDLIQGSDFAKEKLDKMAEKEKFNSVDKPAPSNENPESEETPEEKPKEKKELTPEQLAIKYQKNGKKLFPEIQDEINGNIERVWTCTDGSGRFWVKVINNKWLDQRCETGDEWGILCQGGSFGNSKYVNYQLLGPPKGRSAPIKTIIGMGVLKSHSSIGEVKQEENVQPGSQKTSGGWEDADEQLIEFLSYSPETKWIQYFGDYSGEIRLNARDSLHGGGIGFLYHLANEKPELFKKLSVTRPDIIQNNLQIIEQIFPNVEELLNFNIIEFAQSKPDAFLLKIKEYLKKYGQEAVDALNQINLIEFAVHSPSLIQNILSDLTEVLDESKINEIINKMDLSNYVYNNKLSAYSFFKKLSILNRKSLLKNIIEKYSVSILEGAGSGIKGVMNFLKEMEKPKLPNHEQAKKDLEDGKYYGEREENIKDANGKDVRDINGNIKTKIVEFEIPDNLLIMSQKERRDFINLNQKYIKDSIKSDDKGKEISFLRLLFSQSNRQEIEKNMNKEKDQFVEYYDNKFRLGEKKNVLLPNSTEKIEASYMPGEFELFSILNPKNTVTNNGKLYYPIGVEESKKNIKSIIKYYYDSNVLIEANNVKKTYGKRLTKDLLQKELQNLSAKLKYSSLKDYILTLIYSGESEEEAIKYFVENFYPEKLNLNNSDGFYAMLDVIYTTVSKGLFYKTLEELKPKLFSIGQIGQDIYNRYYKMLEVREFQVTKGELITYINNETPEQFGKQWSSNLKLPVIDSGPIFLTEGRRYKILDVGNYAGSKNGKILIKDEGFVSYNNVITPPTERWFNIALFEAKSKIISQPIQESLVRSFLKKRINMIAESKKKTVSYTGIVLDGKSQKKLFNWIKEMQKAKKLPQFDGWTISSDHVTINTGKSNEVNLLNKQIDIKVLKYAFDENIAAISIVPIVDGVEIDFTNEKPHITLAYNQNNGATPKLSNKLSNWKFVPKSFLLSGTVKEQLV